MKDLFEQFFNVMENGSPLKVFGYVISAVLGALLLIAFGCVFIGGLLFISYKLLGMLMILFWVIILTSVFITVGVLLDR